MNERLEALRKLMAERHIDAYLIPTSDFHESEYVGEYFKCREFITGFTGSAGTAVVTKDEAGLPDPPPLLCPGCKTAGGKRCDTAENGRGRSFGYL